MVIFHACCCFYADRSALQRDVKLCQLAVLLAEIKAVQDLFSSDIGYTDTFMPRKKCGVIMCGDFNLLPESQLYRFMSEGRLSLGLSNRTTMSAQVFNSSTGLYKFFFEYPTFLSTHLYSVLQVRFSDPYVYQKYGKSLTLPPRDLCLKHTYPPSELRGIISLACTWLKGLSPLSDGDGVLFSCQLLEFVFKCMMIAFDLCGREYELFRGRVEF